MAGPWAFTCQVSSEGNVGLLQKQKQMVRISRRFALPATFIHPVVGTERCIGKQLLSQTSPPVSFACLFLAPVLQSCTTSALLASQQASTFLHCNMSVA
eukprot:357461-Chlamydomonas_euryale.AAC.3